MKSKKILFTQPVLAPYSIPRYEALGRTDSLDIHIVLERDSFAERPGWVPVNIDGCTVHLLKSPSYNKTKIDRTLGFSERYTKALPLGLIPLLKKLRVDAVICCNPTQMLLAALAKVLVPFKLGLNLEDTVSSQVRKPKYIQFFRKLVYRRADFILSFSRLAKQYAESIGINANLYETSWSIDPKWLSMERISKIRTSCLRFLFVGQLNERKGILPLIHSWAKYIRAYPGSTLTIIGDGPLGGEAQRQCVKMGLKSVIFLGHIPYKEVQNHYLSSDVFILPTFEDLFSLAVTEAMAFGLPILTTLYNGASTLVDEETNGFIFDPNRRDGITSALMKAGCQAERLPSFGVASRQIISDYTHELVMKRLALDILLELE